jgi:hypothetical protein
MLNYMDFLYLEICCIRIEQQAQFANARVALNLPVFPSSCVWQEDRWCVAVALAPQLARRDAWAWDDPWVTLAFLRSPLPENQKPSCSRACRARSRQVAHVTQPVLRSHMSLEGQRQHGARVGSSAPPPFVVRCRCARRPEGRKADPTSRPARWFALYESRFVLCSLSLSCLPSPASGPSELATGQGEGTFCLLLHRCVVSRGHAGLVRGPEKYTSRQIRRGSVLLIIS